MVFTTSTTGVDILYKILHPTWDNPVPSLSLILHHLSQPGLQQALHWYLLDEIKFGWKTN